MYRNAVHFGQQRVLSKLAFLSNIQRAKEISSVGVAGVENPRMLVAGLASFSNTLHFCHTGACARYVAYLRTLFLLLFPWHTRHLESGTAFYQFCRTASAWPFRAPGR